jgi:hypothetical protein
MKKTLIIIGVILLAALAAAAAAIHTLAKMDEARDSVK